MSCVERYGVNDEQLKELEEVFQEVAISAISKKLFVETHLESHIFYELKRSSKEKAANYISEILNEDNGVIRVAEIIANSGSDSTNGPYVQIDEKIFFDVINLALLKEKASTVNAEDQPIHIQAVINSILDGRKYYLRDGQQRENW